MPHEFLKRLLNAKKEDRCQTTGLSMYRCHHCQNAALADLREMEIRIRELEEELSELKKKA